MLTEKPESLYASSLPFLMAQQQPSLNTPAQQVAIVGDGRMGRALAKALREAGVALDGPLGYGANPAEADLVLLCVPDQQIHSAASAITFGPLVGHCSGASLLTTLLPHEGFSLHPLMTVTTAGAVFEGSSAAIAATTSRGFNAARSLAIKLGMRPIEVAESDRVAYHAAASMASNFLITLESAAEDLAGSAGVDREALGPLVRATVENWIELGPSRALTGPVARGDEATLADQREAIRQRMPELLPLFDLLVDATRDLAAKVH